MGAKPLEGPWRERHWEERPWEGDPFQGRKGSPSQTILYQSHSHHAPSYVKADFGLSVGRSAVEISFLDGLFFEIKWLRIVSFGKTYFVEHFGWRASAVRLVDRRLFRENFIPRWHHSI